MAKVQKDNKLINLQKKQDEINSKSKTPLLSEMVLFIQKNGPTTVNQLLNHFEGDCPKKIRKVFQKQGLKRGALSAIKVDGLHLTINTQTGKSIYQVK